MPRRDPDHVPSMREYLLHAQATVNRDTSGHSLMDAFTALGLVILGLVLLAGGGEALVRGATTIAELAGVTPAVIGLTVVAIRSEERRVGKARRYGSRRSQDTRSEQ